MNMIQVSKIYAESGIGDTLNEFISGVQEPDADFVSVTNLFIKLAIPLSIFCAGLLLSFAAFKMISSKGDPEALKDAREQIGNAVTGLIFILLSGALFLMLSRIILTGTSI